MPITYDDIEKELERRQAIAAVEAELERRSLASWPTFRGAAAQLNAMFDTPGARHHEVMISGPSETGKAQPLDAIVYTPSGPKRMGDLRVGDLVLTPDGRSAPIDGIFPQGVQDVYRITFGDGDWVECTDDHLWKVRYHSKTGSHTLPRAQVEREAILPLRAIRERYLTNGNQNRKFWLPLTQPVAFDARPVRIDPYVLGVLLGDGHLRTGAIFFSSKDAEIVEEVRHRLGERYRVVSTSGYDYAIRANDFKPRRPATGKPGYIRKKGPSWEVTGRLPGATWKYIGKYPDEAEAQAALDAHAPQAFSEDELHGDGIWNDIAAYGLEDTRSATKFVPDDYLYNSVEVRRAIACGLLDTDGTVDPRTGSISFSSISKQLSEHVKFLVDSLGGTARIIPRTLSNGNTDYRVRISADDPASLFLLERKRALTKARTHYPVKRMIAKIELVDQRECQCISVQSTEHLYLTNNCAVTHNTFSALWLLDRLMRHYPGAQATLCRKLRATMDGSVLNTWRRVITIRGGVHAYGGENPQWYDYNNGSRVWIAGLDNPGKALSSERDFIYVNQAEDLARDDWQTLTTRATGRGAVADWTMLFGDCNPGPPSHWIVNRRTLKVLESRHEDNPSLFDDAGAITAQGIRTMAVLDALEGVLKERLRFGRWVVAEGAVYAFDKALHLIDAMPEGWRNWKKYRAIDFGFNNPFTCLWGTTDRDGRLYIYRQLYMTERTVDVHAKTIKRVERWYKTKEDYLREAAEALRLNQLKTFEATYALDEADDWMIDRRTRQPVPNPLREKIESSVADHDAEDRATLAKERIITVPAKKSISPGIQAVQKRLRKAGDGRPRLYVLRGSLIERDETLAAKYLPYSLEQEFDSYVWPKNDEGKPMKEAPIKLYDHALDPLRYLVMHLDRSGNSIIQ